MHSTLVINGNIYFLILVLYKYHISRIGGVMVCVLVSSAVDHEFKPKSGQTIDYKIGICCLSAKHAAVRIKR